MPSFQTAPDKDIIVSTKEEIAKIYACEDKDGSFKPIVTRGTAAVIATSDILSTGSRNTDAAKVLDAAMQVISNPEASITARKAAMKDMETVQEYLRHSGNALIAAAKHSAPVAGFKKAHEDEERKKLRGAKAIINESMKQKKRKNQPEKLPEVLLLDDYVKQKKGEETSLAQAQVVSPDDKRLTRSSTSVQSKSTNTIYDKAKLPKPQNGTSYTKPEAISVIENALQDTSQGKAPTQRQVIMAIISACYIPVNQRNMEKMMKKHKSGEVILDLPWGGGNVIAVPDDIVTKTAESIRNGTNEGLDMQGTVKKMITDFRAGRQEKAGLVPDPKAPSHSTVDKYVVKMVQHGASIVDNVISKTETRSTNEKSERGPISNVALVGATQFEVMDEEDRELNTQLENASFQTRALYELVRKARGGAPIWAIRPQLLFSTDDTTAYIFDGKAGKEGRWVFASDRAIKNRGTHSIYRQEKRANIRTVTLLDASKEVKASKLLDNDEWFKYLVHLFDMSTMMENIVVTEEQKKNADVLTVMLRIRLKNHINNPNRIGSEDKRNHWIWDWAEKNVPVCAAYMILAGHVKPNFQSVNDKDSLLSSDSNKFIPINQYPNRHGVYLNNDTKLQQPIRSGKKTSFGAKVEGFAVRIEQHKKGCSASNPTSNFYKLYPSNSSGRSRNRSKQGVYEDLEHVIALSYDPKGDAAQKVNLDCRGGGVMILNSHDVQRVKSSMPTKPYTDIEKFQLLLSYLFELGYDLAIAPGVNVSESPGFESFGMVNL